MPKEVQLTASYSQFSTYFSGNSNWTHFNISYFPQGLFKGLCLRDQVEVDNGGVQGLLSGNPRQVASHLIGMPSYCHSKRYPVEFAMQHRGKSAPVHTAWIQRRCLGFAYQ